MTQITYNLQPLRISEGWSMSYNNAFYEVDPVPELVPENDRWWVFKQDMLQMKHERKNRVLDVGWTSEGDLENGFYRLVVYEGDFAGKLLYEIETKERLLLVKEIENLLKLVSSGKL